MKVNYIDCACSDPKHTLRFTSDAELSEFVTEVHLNQYYGFFKRVWLAIKYVFGRSNKNGHFDCTILNLSQVEELSTLLKTFKKDIKKHEQRRRNAV